MNTPQTFEHQVELPELRDDNQVMSSVELAEMVRERHDNVMVKIRDILTELYPDRDALDFQGIYLDAYGRKKPCFYLPKKESCIFVMRKYTKFSEAIYNRWQELEDLHSKSTESNDDEIHFNPNDPKSVMNAFQALALKTAKQAEQLEDTVPKADYHDMMMVRDKEMGLREFGKSVQMSQDEFMAFLKEHGYRLKTNDRIEMMQKYIDTGLFVVREVMCRDNKMRPQVMVTPKGQEVLKKHIMQLRRELDL